jgi:hypothetical protein
MGGAVSLTLNNRIGRDGFVLSFQNSIHASGQGFQN